MNLKFLNGRLAAKLALPQKPIYDFKVFGSMCIHRHIDPESCNSMIELMMFPNPRFVFSRRRGDALIDRARSMEASRFLETDCDVLLFLDDDIIYKPEDAVKICRAVMDGHDIVGGAYTLKADGGEQFNIKFLKDNRSATFGDGGGLMEVRYVSSGFMAISRKVLDEISKTLPACEARDIKFYPFFQPFPKFIEDNQKWFYLSEDWALCERAKGLGFKIWCDTSIKLGHAGRYVYNWDDFLRGKKEGHDSIVYNEKYEE